MGDPNFTPPPDYDQRGPGFGRVVNDRIDIGAFEVQASLTLAPYTYSDSYADCDGNIDPNGHGDSNCYCHGNTRRRQRRLPLRLHLRHVQVTVQTTPAGLAFTVDGTTLQLDTDVFLGAWFESHHCHNFAAERWHGRSVHLDKLERRWSYLSHCYSRPLTRPTQPHSGRNIT